MNDKLRKKRNCAKVCIMRNINIFGFSLRRKWEFHTRKNVLFILNYPESYYIVTMEENTKGELTDVNDRDGETSIH